MARNTGKGHRIGAVKGRSEFKLPSGNWAKRDKKTGQIMNQSKHEHKGVRNEK